MLRSASTISKFTLLVDCLRTSFTFPTTSREPHLITRGFCFVKCMNMKNVLMKLWTHSCLSPFSQGGRNCSVELLVSCCMVKWVYFFSTSELLCPKMKLRLRLKRARPNFYMINDNTNISLGIVDCSLSTRLIASKDDYHEKRMHMFAYTTEELNYLEILAMNFISPARQNHSFEKTNLTMLQFVELTLQRIQTLQSHRTLKIRSGINNLISDKLGYPEKVSQSQILRRSHLLLLWNDNESNEH